MYLPGKKYKCISFLLIVIMVFVTIAGAVLTAPVCIYAISLGGLRTTIASLIISLMLQAGVAPTNSTWINQINASYGVESSIGTIENMVSNGLLTETAEGLVDTGLSNAIQNAPAYDLIDDIFTTVVNDVGVTQATGAVNLANTAINCGTIGTIGAFAGAVTVGVGVGVLANHLKEKFTNFIKYGFPMDANEYLTQEVNGYNGYVYFIQTYDSRLNRTRIRKINLQSGRIGSAYYNNNGKKFELFNVDPTTTTYLRESNYNLGTGAETDISENTIVGNSSYVSSFTDTYTILADNYVPHFDTLQQFEDYKYNVQNGIVTLPEIYSPDLIGQNGNQTYNDTNNNVPDIRNIVPDGYDMTPVDMDDYLDYVDQANDNTNNNDVGQETQGQDFDDFVNPYFVDTADQPILPDNPNDVPVYPDRPVNPVQPNIPPKTDVSNEDIQQSLEGATTIDLRSVFPFCIPWDIYNLVLIFDTGEDREAPHITFTFPFNENWIVDVDLSEYDSVAAILRLLELIVFIMGLMVATRNLIGAKG